MPYTKDGVRADLIMDPSSLPSRSNVGLVYEQYFNGASRKLRDIVRHEPDDNVAWSHVIAFLEAYGGPQLEYYSNATPEEQREILTEIREKEFYLHYSVSSDKRAWEVVQDLEKTPYKPLVDNLLINYRGKVRETRYPAMIAPIYEMLLCKTPEESLMACSVPRFNHYMVAVGNSSAQKLSKHISNSPIKIYGETENRMLASIAGDKGLVEIQDRNCSIPTLKHIIDQILTAEHPGFCDNLVDRSKYKFGHNSALSLMKHVFEVGGIGIEYKEDPNYNFNETMIPGIGLKDVQPKPSKTKTKTK